MPLKFRPPMNTDKRRLRIHGLSALIRVNRGLNISFQPLTVVSASVPVATVFGFRNCYHRDTMRITLLLAMLAIPSIPTEAQDRSQARSMVISDRGIVATSQTIQPPASMVTRGDSVWQFHSRKEWRQ
jgi:hypothetical protein